MHSCLYPRALDPDGLSLERTCQKEGGVGPRREKSVDSILR